MSHFYVPALGIGLIAAFYWSRVLKLAHKTRVRTGHGANVVPPEPVGRALRWLWFPAVGLWVALPLLAGLTVRVPLNYPLYATGNASIVAWIALAIAILAMIGTLICWKRMGRSWRMGIDPRETTALIVTGPYAYVRHPIYALSSLLMLMSALILPSPAMLAVAMIHLAFLQWEARREERHQLKVHPEHYRDYMRGTGRFIPRSLRPHAPQA